MHLSIIAIVTDINNRHSRIINKDGGPENLTENIWRQFGTLSGVLRNTFPDPKKHLKSALICVWARKVFGSFEKRTPENDLIEDYFNPGNNGLPLPLTCNDKQVGTKRLFQWRLFLNSCFCFSNLKSTRTVPLVSQH